MYKNLFYFLFLQQIMMTRTKTRTESYNLSLIIRKPLVVISNELFRGNFFLLLLIQYNLLSQIFFKQTSHLCVSFEAAVNAVYFIK